MLHIKNTFSPFKRNARNKIINIKNKAQNGAQKFKESFYETKNKPRSKRKSLFLGFTTVLGIFGVILLAPVLPAVAKDLPKKGAKTDQICPAPTPNPALAPSAEITKAFTGAAGALCALAVSSGSFLVGAACGVVVAIGILKAQGK